LAQGNAHKMLVKLTAGVWAIIPKEGEFSGIHLVIFLLNDVNF
jgi:hypothetical protein